VTTNNQSLLDQRKYKDEATLTAKVKAWLEVQPDIAFYKASDRYQKGVSDLIICVQGQFVAAELKDDEGVASAHQKLFIKSILFQGGGIAGVCQTLGEVKDLVDKARQRAGERG
jgi:hypothetical protein